MCVCILALLIQHAKHICRIILSVACLAVPIFFPHSHKRHDFRKQNKLLGIKRCFYFFYTNLCETFLILSSIQRLRWSRGSVLAFGTQVREFKPGRSRRILQGEKILREVKPFVPCLRFTACKRSLNVTWKSGIFRQNSSPISSPSCSSFTY